MSITILAVDRLLDMSRMVINVVGDLVIACIIAKGEGKPGDKEVLMIPPGPDKVDKSLLK